MNKKSPLRSVANDYLTHPKEVNGITIISLIITIIVLLILAGISIAMVTGQNGILNRAKDVENINRIAQIDEQVRLAVADALSGGEGTITKDSLKIALDNNIGSGNYNLTEDETEKIIITVRDKTYSIDKNGNILKKDEITTSTVEIPSNEVVYYCSDTTGYTFYDEDDNELIWKDSCFQIPVESKISVENISNGSYKFVKDGDVWKSNNKGIKSSEATSKWRINVVGSCVMNFSVSTCIWFYDNLTIKVDGFPVINKVSSSNGSNYAYYYVLKEGTHEVEASYVKGSDEASNNGTDIATISFNAGNAGRIKDVKKIKKDENATGKIFTYYNKCFHDIVWGIYGVQAKDTDNTKSGLFNTNNLIEKNWETEDDSITIWKKISNLRKDDGNEWFVGNQQELLKLKKYINATGKIIISEYENVTDCDIRSGAPVAIYSCIENENHKDCVYSLMMNTDEDDWTYGEKNYNYDNPVIVMLPIRQFM